MATVKPHVPGVVLVDANVFFAPRMRDLFMHLHAAEIISIHWTREIEVEWTRNVKAKQNADPQAIQDCLRGMRDAAEGWEVQGYARHMAKFATVEAKDRHVAAAAHKLSIDVWPGRPVALVTRNVKDFPQQAFRNTDVTRHSMSGYLDLLFNQVPDGVAAVAETCRRKLHAPRLTRELYVAVLMKNGCHEFAAALATRWKVEGPVVARDGTLSYAPDTTPRPRKKQPGQ